MNAALLFMAAAAAAASLMQPAPALRAHVDHVVVGIRSLDEGIAAFERLSGITAERGGQHPTRGTENALVSLGAGRYLELIAPRQDAPANADLDRMRALAQPAIIAWAVNVSDMDAARRATSAVGVTLGADKPGSRVTPSGETLRWATADISAPRIATAPFFIRWSASTPHPSTTSPTGCSLSAFEVHDPAAADLSRALNALRVSGVTVRRGDAQIRVTLKCQGRSVTLEGRLS